MGTIIGLQLDPLDTLFFRDSRPFGAATRAEGGLPQPRTLAGALRTRLVSQFADLGQLPELRRGGVAIEAALVQLGCPDWVLKLRFRGPWLARCQGKTVEPLVPAPAILSREGDYLFRLCPMESRELPGWQDDHGLMPLWRAGGGDAKPTGGFLTQRGLKCFLEGGTPDNGDLIRPDQLFGYDERTGLAISPDTLTGADGMLYGIRLLALKPGIGMDDGGHAQWKVCLYAEVVSDTDAPELKQRLEGPLPFGGEGRYVRIHVLDKPHAWPEAPQANRQMWLLTTPAPLKQAHCPDHLPDGVTVRAAATGAPVAFSGWDVARNGPEKTRFAVPAGAAYFVEGKFTPEHGSFCSAEDAAVGWGHILRGTWK